MLFWLPVYVALCWALCWALCFALSAAVFQPSLATSLTRLLPLNEKMSKLWIVHRYPQSQHLLARLSGRGASEIACGAPLETDFTESGKPDVVVLGLEGDFERELEFVHRMHDRLGGCPLILLATTEDATEAARLFEYSDFVVLESVPTPRTLRASIAAAFSRRHAEGLAQRRSRQRIADRFSAWLGALEIPGLLQALDPSLGHLPLMVRGAPGSGRALLARYVELFRAMPNGDGGSRSGHADATIRIHADDQTDANDLARAISTHAGSRPVAIARLWIDEVDSLPAPAQNALADWITHDALPAEFGLERPHWIATAGATRWRDALEPALERAFAPLVIEIPPLDSDLDEMTRFVGEIARGWKRSVGGPDRQLSAAALAALAQHPWQGDRSEVEAVLRATFASTNRDPIDVESLRFGLTRTDGPSATDPIGPEPADLPLADLPIVEARPEVESDRDDAAAQPGGEGIESSPILDAAESPFIEPFDPAATAEVPIDESVALAEASFDLADSEEIAEEAERAEQTARATDPSWRKLARSLSHEIRNPLVSIRTFAELLPEHYEDETFRARFADLVGRDVAHISEIVTKMQDIAEHDPSALEATDVSRLIEDLLEERRERITTRRLLVLRELERDAPLAWAEPASIRLALAGLLDRALDSLPERGDLYIATHHLARGQSGEPRLRILIRHHDPHAVGNAANGLQDVRPESNILEYVLAESIAQACGGSLTLDSSGAQESLILLELRAPN